LFGTDEAPRPRGKTTRNVPDRRRALGSERALPPRHVNSNSNSNGKGNGNGNGSGDNSNSSIDCDIATLSYDSCSRIGGTNVACKRLTFDHYTHATLPALCALGVFFIIPLEVFSHLAAISNALPTTNHHHHRHHHHHYAPSHSLTITTTTITHEPRLGQTWIHHHHPGSHYGTKTWWCVTERHEDTAPPSSTLLVRDRQ